MSRIVPVILAAGRGTRMRTSQPKVLLPLGGAPILRHCLDKARGVVPAQSEIRVVIGHGEKEVRALLSDIADVSILAVTQKEQLGSGHALELAIRDLDDQDIVLVLYGDAPLIEVATLKRLARAANFAAVWLGAYMKNPYGYGRILRDEEGKPGAIVEEKECSPKQRNIQEVNTGFMAARAAMLREWLKKILAEDKRQGEYLLTDVMKHAYADSHPIQVIDCKSCDEFLGANDLRQLAELEQRLQERRRDMLIQKGVYFMHPLSVCILGEEGALRVGRDVRLGANVILAGQTRLGNSVEIGSGSILRDTRIGDQTRILEFCHLDNARIGKKCLVGPFARLRPGSRLGNRVRIGNFVEVKNSKIEDDSKASHLSYLGDASIAKSVNIGAGTITCNYDGVLKHQTTIKQGAFIGSNTALVAPVTIGKDAVIGAGSVISKDVTTGSLALERGKQREVKNYVKFSSQKPATASTISKKK